MRVNALFAPPACFIFFCGLHRSEGLLPLLTVALMLMSAPSCNASNRAATPCPALFTPRQLWSVCDCNATVTAVPTSTTPSLVDSINKLNYTDVASLLTSLKGVDAGHPLQVIAQALKAEIPGLVVPMLPGANLTSALTFLGSLVNSGSASSSASPLSALLNFVKGAGAVAKAANTTNPLGAVLGALTTASANGTTNPLAGLANLVTALAPKVGLDVSWSMGLSMHQRFQDGHALLDVCAHNRLAQSCSWHPALAWPKLRVVPLPTIMPTAIAGRRLHREGRRPLLPP